MSFLLEYVSYLQLSDCDRWISSVQILLNSPLDGLFFIIKNSNSNMSCLLLTPRPACNLWCYDASPERDSGLGRLWASSKFWNRHFRWIMIISICFSSAAIFNPALRGIFDRYKGLVHRTYRSFNRSKFNPLFILGKYSGSCKAFKRFLRSVIIIAFYENQNCRAWNKRRNF